jgi:PAS domain S-box-containing protein
MTHALSALEEDMLAVVDEIRHLSRDLHPGTLPLLGLATTLKAHCLEIEKSYPVRVSFVTAGEVEHLPHDVDVPLFRIAQESLRNGIVHGEAQRLAVSFIRSGEQIELTITDDGRGFDLEDVRQHSSGLGLVSMEERARMVGGELQIVTERRQGTMVRVRCPAVARCDEPLTSSPATMSDDRPCRATPAPAVSTAPVSERPRPVRRHGSSLWAGLFVLLSAASTEAAAPTVRQVLLLQSFDRGSLALDFFSRNFREAMIRRVAEPVNFLQFVIDPSGFADTPEEAIFEFLLSAFNDRKKPDLIVSVGGPAAAFAQRHRRQLFPETPLVFASVDERFVQGTALAGNETSVTVFNDLSRLVEDILRLLPETRNLFVVVGAGPQGRFWQGQLTRELRPFRNRLTVEFSGELSYAETVRRVATLPPRSAIFYAAFDRDAQGVVYATDRVLTELRAAANAPLFGAQNVQIGLGIVGGTLMAIDDLGLRTADVAIRILNGESPKRITTPPQMPGPPVFDWRELARWGISEDRLPPGSLVRFREPTVWERFKWPLGAGVSAFAVASVLIGALISNRFRRQHAEQSLRASESQFRLAMQNVASGLYTLDRQGRVTYVNPAAEAMFRSTPAELLGSKMHDVIHYKHPDGRAFPANECPCLQVLEHGIELREHEDFYIRKDGTFFPVVISVSPLSRDGIVVGIVVGFRDDAQRREAEHAVRESEARFRLIANTAPVMIWITDVDGQVTYLNQTWLDFTGLPLAAGLGAGWMQVPHPDEVERLRDAYVKASTLRQPFEVEQRLRRHDGEYRWVVSTGVPRYHGDGVFAGYIGTAIDITDRKLAEAALSELSRRLMEAQEKERAWIARELHDDLAQKAVALQMQLERVARARRSIEPDRVLEIVGRARDLGRDIQAVSHRLHSYTLEHLGLANAVTRFCEEQEQQHGMKIALTVDGIRPDLPQAVALALFRVLQEAVANATKHSGVQRVMVTLRGDSHEVQLHVVDNGKGFDLEAAKRTQGLGLVSMRERLSLVNGEIVIESRPGAGTRIGARVPLSSPSARNRETAGPRFSMDATGHSQAETIGS